MRSISHVYILPQRTTRESYRLREGHWDLLSCEFKADGFETLMSSMDGDIGLRGVGSIVQIDKVTRLQVSTARISRGVQPSTMHKLHETSLER